MEALYSEKFTADIVMFACDSHHSGWNEEDETKEEQQSDIDMSIIVQQDATVYSSLYFRKTALHVSGGTSTHHREHM